MKRRPFLTTLGGGALVLAGCTTRIDQGGPGDESPTATDTPTGETDESALPTNCPTTQGLDVDWPTTLDAATVETFVEAYEHVYYRDVVVEYEPESQLDAYELGGSTTSATKVGNGWTISYSGSGGVYRPTLRLSATTAAPPDGADVVPMSEIDDDVVISLVEEAADTGAAERHVEPPGETVDRYVDLLASLSDDFDPLTGPGDSDSLYVDVDSTPVELTARADRFHGDYWWKAWYYVDEQVVRRTTDEDTTPPDGTVLECRQSD